MMKTQVRDRVSLSTIARQVGVHKSVAYTVLNNRVGRGIFVSREKQEKIRRIADELGYVAPKSARELSTGKSNSIGVILHRLIPPFSQLINLLLMEAHKKGLDITLYVTDGDSAMEEHYLAQIRDGRVDGIISLATTEGSPERLRKFSEPPYNLKILVYGQPFGNIPTVHFDEQDAGRKAARHLMDIGCQRFAFFGGHPESVRGKAFVEYLAERGHKPLVCTGAAATWNFDQGLELARPLLQRKSRPDGVFANSDPLGIALISEAVRQGLRIPEDIAVMGCDNIEAGRYINPTLTSIDINSPLAAKALMEKMVEMIEGKNPAQSHTKIPVSIVARESTNKGGGNGKNKRK